MNESDIESVNLPPAPDVRSATVPITGRGTNPVRTAAPAPASYSRTPEPRWYRIVDPAQPWSKSNAQPVYGI
jgi:hypothetical protein